MQPDVGSYTMATGAAAVTINTATYPADGKGAVTEVAEESFVIYAQECLLVALNAHYVASGEITLFHGDNTEAAFFDISSNVTDNKSLDCGDGIRLVGNWYFESTITAPQMTLLFKVVT